MTVTPTVGGFITAQDYALPKFYEKCLNHFYEKAFTKFETDEDFKILSKESQALIMKQQRDGLRRYIQKMDEAAKVSYCSRTEYG